MRIKFRSLKNELERLKIFTRHDREMAKILLSKDIYKMISALSPAFRKNFERQMERYVERLDSPRVSKVRGVKFFHRLRDFESLRDVLHGRDYELLKEFVPKSGDYVIDAGAGVGEYAVVASTMVGRHGKVLAVEASAEPFHYLRKNSRLNPHKNIAPLRAAISDKKGKIKIFRPEGTSFVDSITKSWHGPTHSYSVNSITVDELVRKFKLGKLDLLKLDIEGAELLALRGAKKTMSKLKPKIIIETHGEVLHKKVRESLKKSGYKIDLEKIKFRDPFTALIYASPVS